MGIVDSESASVVHERTVGGVGEGYRGSVDDRYDAGFADTSVE